MANAMRVNVFAAAAVIAAVLVAGADAQGLQLPGFIPFGAPATRPRWGACANPRPQSLAPGRNANGA